jgi:hypothetical protein
VFGRPWSQQGVKDLCRLCGRSSISLRWMCPLSCRLSARASRSRRMLNAHSSPQPETCLANWKEATSPYDSRGARGMTLWKPGRDLFPRSSVPDGGGLHCSEAQREGKCQHPSFSASVSTVRGPTRPGGHVLHFLLTKDPRNVPPISSRWRASTGTAPTPGAESSPSR